jgi:hypothetical protein
MSSPCWEDPKDLEVSEVKVMHSAAGYYIGREQFEDGIWWPYSRESVEYWPTLREAVAALSLGTWSSRREYALEYQR